MNHAILKAFYHKGRKIPVAWTVTELERRTKLSPNALAPQLLSLAQFGLATGHKANCRADKSTWQLTEKGEAELRRILAAEAFVRAA